MKYIYGGTVDSAETLFVLSVNLVAHQEMQDVMLEPHKHAANDTGWNHLHPTFATASMSYSI